MWNAIELIFTSFMGIKNSTTGGATLLNLSHLWSNFILGKKADI